MSKPTGPCKPKYYCDGKATKSDWKACPKGHSCSGPDQPMPCGAGYYQDDTAQSKCKPCPAGYYCNDTYGPVIHYGIFECPTGYYCPNLTEYATKFPCPLGTFNNLTKRRASSDCIPCTGGFSCDEPGLSSPYKLCSAGYFCKQWANSTTPDLGSYANECPLGYFCPKGKYVFLN